jgi:hypothetical protein
MFHTQFQITIGDDDWTFFEAAYDADGRFMSGNVKPSVFRRLR